MSKVSRTLRTLKTNGVVVVEVEDGVAAAAGVDAGTCTFCVHFAPLDLLFLFVAGSATRQARRLSRMLPLQPT